MALNLKSMVNPWRFSKPWQSALLVVLLLSLFGFLVIQGIRNESAEPIVIDDQNLSKAEVQTLQLALQPVGSVQFFGADLAQIYERVADLPWVEDVTVSRDWSYGVMVSVIPRKPIANFGDRQMVDANGKVFTPVDGSVLASPNLVTLHGKPEDAPLIMAQMHRVNTWFLPLNMQIKEVNLMPRKTWVFLFNNGLRVVVDREDTERKLYLLSKVLSSHYQDQLKLIQSVDLRYKDGFVIAWRSNAPQTTTNIKTP